MPRYFFHVRDGFDLPDREGAEFSDLAVARLEAVRAAGKLLSNDADHFWNGREWIMTVTNEAGLVLFTLEFVATEAPVARPH
jgi:hypothetical protein